MFLLGLVNKDHDKQFLIEEIPKILEKAKKLDTDNENFSNRKEKDKDFEEEKKFRNEALFNMVKYLELLCISLDKIKDIPEEELQKYRDENRVIITSHSLNRENDENNEIKSNKELLGNA